MMFEILVKKKSLRLAEISHSLFILITPKCQK